MAPIACGGVRAPTRQRQRVEQHRQQLDNNGAATGAPETARGNTQHATRARHKYTTVRRGGEHTRTRTNKQNKHTATASRGSSRELDMNHRLNPKRTAITTPPADNRAVYVSKIQKYTVLYYNMFKNVQKSTQRAQKQATR